MGQRKGQHSTRCTYPHTRNDAVNFRGRATPRAYKGKGKGKVKARRHTSSDHKGGTT
jgi:hypothetical protein